MGERSRAWKGLPERLSSAERGRRPTEPDAPGAVADAVGGEGAGGSRDAGSTSRKTHAIVRLDDGTVCIGADCAVIRIPPTGDIQIDARECPDDVADKLTDRLMDGAGADFKLKPRGKKV